MRLLLTNFRFFINSGHILSVLFVFIFLIVAIFFWIRVQKRETILGGHWTKRKEGLYFQGFVFFILRERILFFSLFWRFFLFWSHSIGTVPAALFVEAIPHYRLLPLLNLILLLSRRVTLTVWHFRVLLGKE